MRRAAILAIALVGLVAGMTAGAGLATETRIQLHRIDDPVVQAFATLFFYKRHPHMVNWSFAQRYRSDENWTDVVRRQVYAAEIELSGDGVPQLLLTVDNPNWCQANGCLSAIFRKAKRGYELICEAALPPPEEPGAVILGEIENGYHRLATRSDLIVWNAKQDYKLGRTLLDRPAGRLTRAGLTPWCRAPRCRAGCWWFRSWRR